MGSGEEIIEVRCGYSHSMAISENGKIFTWGEGIQGKLGLGYSETLKSSKNQSFPLQVKTNLISKESPNQIPDERILAAGCGRNISVLVQDVGSLFAWGKSTVLRQHHNDYKNYSLPRNLS